MFLTKDRHGEPVAVGDRVLVHAIDKALISSLRGEELSLVKSMIGSVLVVTEIDEFGYATVEKQIQLTGDRILSQTVSLIPDEMDKVKQA